MATETQQKKSKYPLHFAVMLIIMFCFRFIPPPGSVTPYGMAVLGIFLGLIYGWTFINLLIPSLCGAVLLATTDYGTCTEVFVAMFSNSTVLMMLLGVLAFMAVQQSGAGDWIIAKLLSSKLVKRSPIFLLEIFILVFVLGNIVGLVWFLYFALMPIMAEMFLRCGYEKGDKLIYFFFAGCLMAGQTGMSLFPFMGWSLMTCGTMMQLTQTPISYNTYMALMLIVIALEMITLPLLMKVCRCDFSKLASVDVDSVFPAQEGKLNTRQKLATISVLLFIIVVVVASMLAGSVPALNWLNTKIGVVGFMVVLWIFIIACKTDGKPILDMRQAASDFQWDMLMLIAVALLISSALTAEPTGISGWMAGLLMPLFAGVNPLVFLLVLAVVTIVLTNLGNNIAVCFVMINLTCAMYNNGFPVNITAAALIISLSSVFVAYLTPAASLPGALMHSNPAMTSASVYKGTVILMIYGALLLMAVVVPYILIAG